MEKYHITPDGIVMPCQSKKRDCPYKNTKHFSSIALAEQYRDSMLEEETISENNAKKLSELVDITVPMKLFLNDVHKKGFWARIKMVGKCYRGEVSKESKINNGLAMYGKGVYSTTSKQEAQQYGDYVRKVFLEELPVIPLCIKSPQSFNYLEQLICEEYKINKRDLYKYITIENLIEKMGYDGLVIGPNKKNLTIVKYF